MTPTDLEAELARVDSLYRKGLLNPARQACAKMLTKFPDSSDAYLMMGCIELDLGNLQSAISMFTQAVRLSPQSALAHENLGKAFFSAQQFDSAAAAFQKVTRLRPDDPDNLFRLGLAHYRQRRFGVGETALRAAIALQSDFPDAERVLINLLLAGKATSRAINVMEIFLKRHPDEMSIVANLIVAYEKVNRLDESENLANRFLEENPGEPRVELTKAAIDGRRGNLEEAERRLRQMIKSGNLGNRPWVVYFRLGAVLDRIGNYTEAFEIYVTANRMQIGNLGGTPQKAANYLKFVAANSMWINSVESVVPFPSANKEARSPVFFVGFPRSGTTLLETILTAHPDVVTTQENPIWSKIVSQLRLQRGSFREPVDLDLLTVEEIAGIRAQYMELAEKDLDKPIGKALLIDKLPLNIVRLPLIRTIFPESRIIVSIRDPRDVCLSCFMQSFDLNPAMEHFHDILTSANLYAKVMTIWLTARNRGLMSAMEYRYEDLVGDVYAKTREILRFIGVPWNDEIFQYAAKAKGQTINTPSYRDVTDPINNKAIGRWRNYRRELEPILPILAPFAKEWGYDPD